MAHTKAEWRERLLRARRTIDLEARRAASAAVVGRLAALGAFTAARSVYLYVALGAEIDPAALAPLAWESGKQVWRPATSDLPPSWQAIPPPAVLGRRDDGSLAASPALVLVPGLAFDLAGRRLGRGLGYYDRALATLRREGPVHVIGLAYELQIVPELPRDPWDETVDLVVTEQRLLVCGAPGGAGGRLGPSEVRDEL